MLRGRPRASSEGSPGLKQAGQMKVRKEIESELGHGERVSLCKKNEKCSPCEHGYSCAHLHGTCVRSASAGGIEAKLPSFLLGSLAGLIMKST